mgnify:CR=1 FL=1
MILENINYLPSIMPWLKLVVLMPINSFHSLSFLGIPCLILTDLDSVSGQKGANGRIYYNSVPVSCGETTSNETLKWWVRKNKGASRG